ncbi:MAG: hypothetical protein MJ189_01875, partial [Coriobacteriales bacterium]|nr:hypothetical protein [Coriobacteriales bacterium]
MNKKIAKISLVIVFILLCTMSIVAIFFGNFLDIKNYENREMAQKPQFSFENYQSYPKDFEAYLNDNVPFRNALISLNSSVDYFLFHKSTNDEVVVAKDNWLFYNHLDSYNISDMDIYQGKNLYDNESLEKIATKCMENKKYLESLGKKFYIVIGPSTQYVY